jgi:DNA uptake protein ComE-like DNA-binding protein
MRSVKRSWPAIGSVLILLLSAACGGEARSPASSEVEPADIVTSSPAEATQGANSEVGGAPAASTLVAKLNLNSASGSDFQSAIPNFPSNMVREFLEYRPYVSIQQFRREIGKYVSASQVAEWEKYVYVPVDANNSDAETLKQLPGVSDAIAAQLVASRPFSSNDAFLVKLATLISASDTNAAKGYLKS